MVELMENRYLSEKIKEIENKVLRKVYSNHIPLHQFKREIMRSEDYRPIFFLSTGRTGTKFFTELLRESKGTSVFHSIEPELVEQGKKVYETYKSLSNKGEITSDIDELVGQMFLSAREEVLYKEFIRNKVYVETNNRITFLAPGLKKVFPNARFIFLHRHPGEFIRSGLRRNWYSGGQSHDIGRIVPVDGSALSLEWENVSNLERIAWLWNETNLFIDHFVESLDEGDYYKFNFNNLSFKSVKDLLSFLDIKDISDSKIEKLLPQKVNAQKSGQVESYENWSFEEREKVKAICGELAGNLGHHL